MELASGLALPQRFVHQSKSYDQIYLVGSSFWKTPLCNIFVALFWKISDMGWKYQLTALFLTQRVVFDPWGQHFDFHRTTRGTFACVFIAPKPFAMFAKFFDHKKDLKWGVIFQNNKKWHMHICTCICHLHHFLKSCAKCFLSWSDTWKCFKRLSGITTDGQLSSGGVMVCNSKEQN